MLEHVVLWFLIVAVAWKFAPGNTDCCDAIPISSSPCSDACLTGTTPRYWLVTISGTLTDAGCTLCNKIPATYVVDTEAHLGFLGGCFAEWRACFCGHMHSVSPVDAAYVGVLLENRSGTRYISVIVNIGTEQAIYEVSLGGAAIDCTAISETLSYVSSSSTSCTGWSGLTVSVSATSGPAPTESQCDHCLHNTDVEEFDVIISGLTNQNCAACSGTTIRVSRVAGTSCCEWQGTKALAGITYTAVLSASGGVWTADIGVVCSAAPAGDRARYTRSPNDAEDCSAIASASMTYSSMLVDASDCDGWSTANVLISAVAA